MEQALSTMQTETQTFITKVYAWMCVGLLTTAAVAWVVAATPTLILFIIENRFIFFGMLIAEFLAVVFLVTMVNKMSSTTATITFLAYAILNGFTFSIIFLIYTTSSIGITFLITAGMFGIMSAYGYITKTDLTSAGNFAFMGLIGIILGSFANFFLNNQAIYWITTYIGILVFIVLTAYDTQKIKKINVIGNEGTDQDRKEAIIGALILYLDFVNLFLNLLRLFGKRRK